MPEHSPRPIAEIHAARAIMLAGRPRDALRRLAAIRISFATLSIVKGECCYALGQWADAAQFFEEAITLSPNSPRAEILLMLACEMLDLGTMMKPKRHLISRNEPATSTDEFRNPITRVTPQKKSEPEDEIGLVSETLAELMIRQGKLEEARKVYIQLSRLDPERYEYFRERIHAIENPSEQP